MGRPVVARAAQPPGPEWVGMYELVRSGGGRLGGIGSCDWGQTDRGCAQEDAIDDPRDSARAQISHLTISGVPTGISLLSVRIARLVRRMQPCEIRPGIRSGRLVP